MAREIKTTPIIRGKDAVIFYKNLEENQHKKVDTNVLQRIEKSLLFFKENVVFV